jgi:hypothetical protein
MKKQGTKTTKNKVDTFAEVGTIGLRQSGGIIEEEWLRELQGEQKIKTLKTMEATEAIAFAGIFISKMAIKQVKFWFNEAGDTEADAQAKIFAEQCREDLEDAWGRYTDEWMTCIALGYSVAETVYKLRVGPDEEDPSRRSLYDDGKIGWRKFAFRPQETLDHWEFDPDNGELLGMWQRDPIKGESYFIPKTKMLHFVMNSTKGNPEGLSQLRGAYPAYYKKHKLEEAELVHIIRNVAGIPELKIPSVEFKKDKDGGKSPALQTFEDIGRDFYKNEESYFIIPSDVYQGTQVPMYHVGLTADQQPSGSLPTTEPINRCRTDIALVLNLTFMLLGSNTVGSHALAETQADFFVMFIEGICDMICEVFNRQAVPQLFKLNTWEGLTGLPKLVHDNVAKTDVAKLGEILLNLMRAGVQVFPNDELQEHIYEELGVPKGETIPTQEQQIAETTAGGKQTPLQQTPLQQTPLQQTPQPSQQTTQKSNRSRRRQKQ